MPPASVGEYLQMIKKPQLRGRAPMMIKNQHKQACRGWLLKIGKCSLATKGCY